MPHKKYLVLTVLLAIGFLALTGYWQSSVAAPAGQSSLWRDIAPGSVVARGQRDIIPSAYRFLEVNEATLAATLARAPREFAAKQSAPVVLELPLPTVHVERFQIEESPLMAPELAAPIPGTVTPCAVNFSDVSPGEFFYDGGRYLTCAGAISGYNDGTFRPQLNTTRGQVVKIVVVAEGFPLLDPAVPAFLDVPRGSTFYRFIETAVDRNIISGYTVNGGLEFRVGNSVTRGQLSKIVVTAACWTLLDPAAPTFRDVPRSNTFYRYIETAVDKGIISGYTVPGGLEFRSGNSATRGQIAKIVHLAVTAPGAK